MRELLSGQSIALVINTYEQAHFLSASIESALKQTIAFNEIIVVDDGSTDHPADQIAGYPEVRLICQPNAGLAAARNTGLNAASSDFIIFLDADDLLTPCAVSSGLACHAENPGAALVYGAHKRIGRKGEPLAGPVYCEVCDAPFRMLLTGNAIGMHATVVYNRSNLCDIGGFDASLPRCEDYDVYFRIAVRYLIASHSDVVALYRWHGQNMSADYSTMLKWVLYVNDRQQIHTAGNFELEMERLRGRRIWCEYYALEFARELRRRWRVEYHLLPAHRLIMAALSFVPHAALELGCGTLRSAWLSARRRHFG